MNTNVKQQDDDSRFQELLPWYVNGTAAANDRAWITEYLARNPEAACEVELEAATAGQIAQEIEGLPGNLGLRGLQDRLRQDRLGRPTQQQGEPHAPLRGGPGRIAAIFGSWRRSQWGWVLASVLQLAVIGYLLARPAVEPVETQYRSLGRAPASTVVVQVRAATTERDLRALLLKEGAEIVAGPSQMGEYRLIAKRGDATSLAKALIGSPIIESVAVERNPGGSQE